MAFEEGLPNGDRDKKLSAESGQIRIGVLGRTKPPPDAWVDTEGLNQKARNEDMNPQRGHKLVKAILSLSVSLDLSL
jgi:hypothetical protein